MMLLKSHFTNKTFSSHFDDKRCFLVSYFGLSNTGGVERVCYYMQKVMQEKGYNVVIVNKELIEQWNLGRIYSRLLGRVHLLAFTILASLYIKSHKKKGDVSIANGFNAPFHQADYLFIHGTLYGANLAISPTNRDIKMKFMFFLEQTASRSANKIVAVSHNAMSEVQKYYLHSPKEAYIINNTVDDLAFYPIERLANSLTTVLYCGRLDYGKGLHKLLMLADKIEQTSNFRFRIATNNPQNMDLFKKFTHTSIVVGLSMDTMNAFYNTGDVFFFPSMYEGFEMVTLEALSAGVPVMGNNIGAVGELKQRKEPGVELILDTADLLMELQKLANRYSNFSEREALHNYYKMNYGLDVYKSKLSGLIL